ncbi:MAG: carboxyl transferase domain-containing protein, partial [Oscillospiraceae bacterium]
NANGDKLKDAGTANMAQKAGVAHIVAKDLAEATAAAKKLVAILPQNNLSSGAGFEFQTPSVTLNMAKYTAQTAALSMVDGDSEVELFADFGNGIYTALATVNGNVCGVIATEKDYLCNTCTSKAARFVRLCDAFGMPVVTVVNTEGFAKSSTEDVNGGLRAAARLTATYADASTAKVCVIVGKAVGTTYTALCNADITIALENAMVAPIEPSAAVTVLYKDELDNCTNLEATTATLVKKYISEVASADKLVEAGLADMTSTNKDAYGAIVSALDMLSTKRCQRLPKKHGNMSL